MAPLVRLLQRDPRFDARICVTGQHREMLDQVLDEFDIQPDYDLQIMTSGQDLTDITCAALGGLRNVLAQDQPDMMLVHGDTSTTFAASLAAYYAQIPVGHVEAGLRTGNLYSPWPEEANRRLATVLATLHFAPTHSAAQNLLNEGVAEAKIAVTGNTVIDSLLTTLAKLENEPDVRSEIEGNFPQLRADHPLVLITAHRRENFGAGFDRICAALIRSAQASPNVDFVFPVHLSEHVQKPVHRHLADISNIHLVAPQEYLSFVYLMDRAALILTDSGGIQEEATALGKPVFIMREATERPEALDGGNALLVGTDSAVIVREIGAALLNPSGGQAVRLTKNPFGDGSASEKIVEILVTAHPSTCDQRV
jgi:UDP-N-acetylglucosamine 2-epimerase (non-hydrolysing)